MTDGFMEGFLKRDQRDKVLIGIKMVIVCAYYFSQAIVILSASSQQGPNPSRIIYT